MLQVFALHAGILASTVALSQQVLAEAEAGVAPAASTLVAPPALQLVWEEVTTCSCAFVPCLLLLLTSFTLSPSFADGIIIRCWSSEPSEGPVAGSSGMLHATRLPPQPQPQLQRLLQQQPRMAQQVAPGLVQALALHPPRLLLHVAATL